MKPVSPVIKGFEQFEIQVGAGQKQYIPIPTVVAEGDDRRFISRWEFSEDERRLIAEGGSLIFQQLTFGSLFQPVSFQITPVEIRLESDGPEDDDCLCNGVGCVRCCGPS